MLIDTTTRIRELNDRFRQTFRGGRLMLTCAVSAMPEKEKRELLTKVALFSEFESGNDPHNEHDFGSVEVAGERYFFKLDYYDPSMEFGSEDPSDPEKTCRVMTVMHVSEY